MSTTLAPPDLDLPASAPAPRPRGRLAHGPAFWAIAATLICFAAASSAPSPLYVVYQQQWGFSAITLTVVFAVYVLGLLGSLLVVGALSDHIGRRPVMAGAIALESVALVLFVVAGGVGVLTAARVLQGIATGAAFTTLSATIVDLQPPRAEGRAGVVNGSAPLVGLALGALGCGALVQYAPAPTHLVYVLLLGGMAVAAAVIWAIPETSSRRPGARASLVPRVRVPARLRADVVALVPALIAGWSLGGLYLSLGPSVAASLFGLQSHLVGGLVVTLMCGTGAATSIAFRARPAGWLLGRGAVVLAAGMAVTLAGVLADLVALAAVGTVVAGVGFGAVGLGSFGTLARIALPDERGELFAVVYVISYLAFSLPAVAAGFAATQVGLHDTAVVYGLVVIASALTAAGLHAAAARRARADAPASAAAERV